MSKLGPITEGRIKKSLNEPPSTPRPPKPGGRRVIRLDAHGAVPMPAGSVTCPRCGGDGYISGLALIGERLRSLREKHGYSLRQVQEITDGKVSNPYLSQIETGGVTNVGAETLITLAALYGVSVDYLLGRTKHG